jgi:hypothetical protein
MAAVTPRQLKAHPLAHPSAPQENTPKTMNPQNHHAIDGKPVYCPGANCACPTCPNFRKFGGPRAAASRAVGAPPSVPLFYIDQNQSMPTPYSVTQAQADAMKAAGRGRYINRCKAFQLCELAPVSPRFTPSLTADSAASISLAEMEANVGIAGDLKDWREEAPAPRHLVQRAQQKVKAIGRHDKDTFDDKATLAFGGHRYNDRWKAFSESEMHLATPASARPRPQAADDDSRPAAVCE